jgi:hypothetical protein
MGSVRYFALSAAGGLMLAGCAMVPVAASTQVVVIPSMHRFHDKHPTYDYARLYTCVRAKRPDLVGVELRPEDIAGSDDYLAKSYPPEMIALRNQHRQHIFGFDWLGPELAGRPIPANWWKEQSVVKKLEREIAADPAMASKQDDELSAAQGELLKTTTPALLADGRYDRLVRARREILRRQAGNGHYAPVVKFTADRERKIGDNIAAVVRANPGRTIVLVMGADHHGFAVERLRTEFGNRIRLEAQPAC